MNHWRLVTISSGPVALLVELDGVRDRPRLADEIARLRNLSTIFTRAFAADRRTRPS